MAEKDEVKLLGIWASPFSRRIEMALKLKGVPYEYVEEILEKKSPLLLALNPIHKKIPVLVHNGKTIIESQVILEYIDETWKHNPLLPQDPYERSKARFLAKLVDEQILSAGFVSMARADEKGREVLAEQTRELIMNLEKELVGKDFFGGKTVGFLDLVAGSVIPFCLERGWEGIGLKYKPMNFIFHVFYLIFIFSAHSSTAELKRLLQPAKPDGIVRFLVIGDWGRRGSYNQSNVALQMGEIGEKLNIDFVISTGDNFYDNGLLGLDDSAFQDSFTNIYNASSLQKPWYTVLGNHDYRGDVEAQLSPMLRALDNRWVCMRSFVVNAEIVEFWFVDTTPFVDKYFVQPNKHVYDWRGVLPRQRYLNNLLKEVDVELKESTAKWKIVIGHHPIKSAGHHRNTIELEKQLLPILHANEVDLYVNGHDHCLEHISSVESKIQFMTSGGGSKAWKGDVNHLDPEELKFYYDGQGFMSVDISEAELSVVFYDVSGNVLHHWKTYKEALYFAS